MTVEVMFLLFAVLLCFYVAWNIGANDVANAVGTSVGSGALSLKHAVYIAAIFEFCGAFFFGTNVSEMVESGIVNPDVFADNMQIFIIGMLASLLSTGVWLQIASYFGWPVSTTHTIVGAVLGFGLVVGGFHSIFWGNMGSIALSWVVSPILGGVVAYLIFSVIRKKILFQSDPIGAAKKVTPYLVFMVFFVLALIIFYGGLKNFDFELSLLQAVGLSVAVGVVAALISASLVRRIKVDVAPIDERKQNLQVFVGLKKAQKHLGRVEAAALGSLHDEACRLLKEVEELAATIEVSEYKVGSSEYRVVEKIFIYLQIITACCMAFAHGSNDVANAIGPLSAIINSLEGIEMVSTLSVTKWLLFLGGVGIVIGLATWGWRVIETVGKKITELTPSRGFTAGFAAAATIVLASKLGLPISTTHVLVGAVLGVGFARGFGAINLNTIRDIVISWLVTVPAGAIFSVLFFYIIKAVFL